MANYKLDYTGEQVNTAIGNALNGGGGGGGGNQLYLHKINITLNSHKGAFYLINDISTQITSITSCNNGVVNNYVGYNGAIVLYKISGMPYDQHTISFKNCIVEQALGFAEDSDGNQTYDCTDTVVAL